MEICLLGPLEVRDGDRVIPVRVPRHRTVLATLALAGGRPVSVTRLLGALAGQREVKPGVIRVYLSDLRKLLPEDLIESVPGGRGYRLRIEPWQVDTERFRSLVGRRETEKEARIHTLREALALWRGPALEDVESDDLRRMDAEPLEELKAEALEELCDLRVQLGEHHLVLSELRDLVVRYPLRESVYRILMIALYRSGNLGEALALYERLRRILDEELGSEPSARLRRLHERILREDPSLASDQGPVPTELPRDDHEFTGRRALLDRLDVVIAGRPTGASLPIVLYGHAGVGKSTLAVHMAWRYRAHFPDGQLFADLRGEPDPGLVLARFLRSLAYPGGTIPASTGERLAAYRTLTAGRRLLVLLDNVSGEEQARLLMPTGPGSVGIITSRSPLAGLAGARPYEVDVFTRMEARELLTRIGGETLVEAEDEATERVIDACAGLPIAVRVVGARLASGRDSSTAWLARRLRDEPSRLNEMKAGDIAVRTPLELGYDGLGDRLEPLLRLMADLSAPDFAPWVAAPLVGAEGAMEMIADFGLLHRLARDGAGQDRFRLHDLTRLLAKERPAPPDASRSLARLASVALGRVQSAVLPLTSEELDASFDASHGMDTTDVRDGVEWLDAERAFLVTLVADLGELPSYSWRLAHALTPFFEMRLYLDEWRVANEHAGTAALAAGDTRGQALILRDLGDLKRAERDLGGAVETYESSLEHLLWKGAAVDRARVLLRLGLVHLERGEQTVAERMLVHGRSEFRACASRRGEARCLNVLGILRHRAGDQDVARDCLMSALDMTRDLGDRHSQAACLHDLVPVRLARGERAAARRLAEEEFDLAGRRLHDPRLAAYALISLALVGHADSDSAAGRIAGEAAAQLRALGDRHGHAWALATVGRITGHRDELALARSLFVELGDVYGRSEVERSLNQI